MSQQLEPIYKIDAYKVANGVDEVNALLEEGYEPYGEPAIYDADGCLNPRQVMVHKRLLSADEYVAIFKPLVETVLPAMQEMM